MTLALSHGGNTVFASETPSTSVLVGTLDGVARIERDGDGWRIAARTLSGAHIHALHLEEESGMWFAGVSGDGIHASTDDGRTWERRDSGITEPNIYSLASVRVDGHVRLFAGTEPARLFASDDLGATWTERPGLRDVGSVDSWTFPGEPHIGHLKHINFLPGDPKTMFASIEVGALLKSTDGGETWEDITGMHVDVHRCVIDPRDTNKLYVTGGAGLWRSADGGGSWENTFSSGSEYGGYPDQLVFKPSNPSEMVVTAGAKGPGKWREEGIANFRISRSVDGGATWEVATGGLPDYLPHAIEAMSLEEAGGVVQIFVATTSGEVLWSDDAGASWSTAVDGLAPITKGEHYRGLAEAAAR